MGLVSGLVLVSVIRWLTPSFPPFPSSIIAAFLCLFCSLLLPLLPVRHHHASLALMLLSPAVVVVVLLLLGFFEFFAFFEASGLSALEGSKRFVFHTIHIPYDGDVKSI